jgi:hypothetical protein
MKSLLCGCIEANVERPTPNVQYRIQKVGIRLIASMSILFFFLDERDVAAALDVTATNVLEIFGFRSKTQIFFEVVSRDVIALHASQNEIAILNNQIRAAFDQHAEPVRVIGECGKEPMN